MAVFITFFAIAGALFFGLRYWGRQVQAQTALLSGPEEGGEALGNKIETYIDNLEFVAHAVPRPARRPKADDGTGASGGEGG